SGSEKFDISITAVEHGGQLQIGFAYSTDLFNRETIERMMSHLQTLLASVTEHPDRMISECDLLSDSERRQVLLGWNDTSVEYPRDTPLHGFIEKQVEKTPDATALIFESTKLSYRELNARANQLAHRLRKLGVGPDVLVAVCADRSIEMVIALLGTLKAGGAYVPLDPEYPLDRLETMLADANPPVVLTQKHLLDRLPQTAQNVTCLDADWPTIAQESADNLPSQITGKNLAYAIYTSGSTGKPKGVANVHEGIVNRLLWMQDTYKLTASDRVLQKTPYSFDVSVWEFFWPLMTGAALVVAVPGGHRDPRYLVNTITREKITTMHFVPSMLGIFLETDGVERCTSLRQVFASGEALPYELQQRFFDRLPAKLHNLYGPTEAAVDVTYWECHPDSGQQIVPIGRPVANTQIYILDPQLRPTPIGVAGELHIGGIQLARGYLNRPDLTSERFIPDPFSHEPGARLYKTGDLARFLSDGNIEYLGRIDHQVKLRGFRIELGEIESVIAECPGVRQAVAVVREDVPGDKRLVAYVVGSSAADVQLDTIRAHAKDKLPDYMVPSNFVVLTDLPMTTSGKVDRKALPAPQAEHKDGALIVEPRTDLESKLLAIFQKTLGMSTVGVTDNFFELGGHSLLAARLVAEVSSVTGWEIPLSALFRGATVESLARIIEEGAVAEPDAVVMCIHAGNGGLPFFAVAS